MIFYQGSSTLLPKFDLSYVLEGEGKVKFGYGVYLTNSFKRLIIATLNPDLLTHYVYLSIQILNSKFLAIKMDYY